MYASQAPPSQPRDQPAADDVLAALAVGVVVHADDGSVVSCNRAALQILAVTEAELLAPDAARLVTDVVREDLVPFAPHELPVARTLSSGVEVRDCVLGRRRADGGVTWMSVSTSLVRRADGGCVVVAALVDITERVEGVRALREAHRSFDVGFDESPIGMLLVDRDGRITRTNASLAQLIGWSADELRGQWLGRILHPDDVALAKRARLAFGAGEMHQLHADRRLVTKSGSVVHVIVSTVPVRDDHGELSHYVTHLVDVTEQRRRHDELSFLADHDPLTGLVNRRGFEVALHACLAVRDAASPPALLMIDLDRFKQVNDVHGHALGDLLITRVAEIITAVSGAGCVVGRIGGDEFVVLLPSAPGDSAERLAQHLVDAIGTMSGGEVAFDDGRIGASVGIAMAPIEGIDGPRLLVRADRALYQAKRAGRGVWAVAPDE